MGLLPNPYLNQYGGAPAPSDPDYSNYLTEHALRAQGHTSLSFNDSYWGPISYSMDWQDDDPYLSGSGFEGAGITLITPKPGTSGVVNASGKVRVRFQWVRDNQNDNPPAVLNLSVHSAAISIFESDPGTGDVANVQLTSQVGIENGASYSGTQENPTQQYPSYLSDVDKYLAIPVSTSSIDSQDRLWSPWFTFDGSSQGDVTIYSPYSKAAQTSFIFDWMYDDRAVEIASSVAPSYYKDGNGNQQAHTRDADGHMTVDTAVTWYSPSSTWIWGGTFNKVLIGSPWGTPQYQWSSNPTGISETASSFPATLFLGGSSKNDPLTTTNSQINLNVTDDDGRQLANTYNMVFHKPFENPVHQEGSDVDCGTQGSDCTNDLFNPSTTAYLAAGESLTFTETPAKYDFGATMDNISVAADAGATVGTLLTEGEVPAPTWVKALEILKVGSSVTSLAVGSPEPDLHPQYTGSYGDFMDAVNDQLSVGNYDDSQERVRLPLGYNNDLLTDIQNSFAGTTALTNPFWNGVTNTTNPNGIKVTFTIFPHRKKQKRYYTGDAYSNDGYDGQVTQPVVKPIVVQAEPQFKLDD